MPFSHPVEIRFRDLDALGHVNHADIVTYFEVARTAWWLKRLKGRPFTEEGFLIARLEVDYRKPIFLQDGISVELQVRQIGGTSFVLAYKILREPGRVVVAEGQSVQVCFDFEQQRPRPISGDLLAWLREQS